ncbi:MAG: histidine decarboxylase [Pirellulales bacterium]|nr:histidine decarboxylase [Pirellulales bacterium]
MAMDTLPASDQRRLDELYEYIDTQSKTFIGYPCSQQFDYTPLFRFLNYPINNVGDPYAPSSYRVNTKEIEREVIQWFAELTHADEKGYWGYVTNGGTEGNLYGLYLARELLASGMVYYSEHTHYSVSKNLRLLQMPNIMIRTLSSGEIDYEDLYETIRIHRDRPPIIFTNVGTTMQQGVDDIPRITSMVHELAIPQFYIHCDAALGGMILPFIANAPTWDFSAGIDSLSISGHKFIGSPIPCGIVLAQKRHVDRIARSIEYVGTLDTTITGSRNGITPLFLWYAIRKYGIEGFRRMAQQCIATAEYAVEAFERIGIQAWRNPFSVTVVFPKPLDTVQKKWQIAVQGQIGHIITMQHVTRSMIDELVADIEAASVGEPVK